MAEISKFQVHVLPMVTREGRQRVDIEYCCSEAIHLFLEVCKGEDRIVITPVALDSGSSVTTLMLPVWAEDFCALWRMVDQQENVYAEAEACWNKARERTIYVMVSSHTDIGLHNSQYIQCYNSSRFLDLAKELCDETQDREINDRYRYVMEGTWFWNNYGMDRGACAAQTVVRDYLKQEKMPVICIYYGDRMWKRISHITSFIGVKSRNLKQTSIPL